MTSQSSTTNRGRAEFLPLFGFTARQFWTTTLLFTIILFFVLPIPVMMVISDRDLTNTDMLMRTRNMLVNTWADGIRYALVPLLSLFGVIVSCARFGYLKNKVSIDFYHSLPLKRSQLYLTQLAVSAVTLIIPYVFNILFTLAVVGINGLMSGGLIAEIIKITIDVAVYTVFFYSLSTLVGMVSGLTAVQLTLTVVAMFIIPATYLVTIAFINIFNENMWTDFYLNTSFFEKSTPVLRFLFNTDMLSVGEVILVLLVSLLMTVGAYVIYLRRKSERAGVPVVFAPLGEVIKYVLVFLGTLCGGLLFYFIMDDFLWTVFGMICGMVLVFMLANTILSKTARAMFNGWRGLCIFGAAATAAFVMLLTNAFGINTNVPAPNFTSRVVVDFEDSGEMEFRDKDVIAALHTIYTEASTVDYDNHATSARYHSRTMKIEIVFYPKVGIPVAKSLRIYNKADMMDEMRTVLDSEEFKGQYISAYDNVGESGFVSVSLPRFRFDPATGSMYEYYASHSYSRYDKSLLFSARAKEFDIDLVIEANKDCSFDFFQQQSFGELRVDSEGTNGYDISHPLLVSMTDVIDRYIENEYMGYTPDEFCQKLADAITTIEVYDNTQYKALEVTDKAQILEILKASANPLGHYYTPYTFTDSEYYAVYTVSITDAYEASYYYDEYGNQSVVMEEVSDEAKRVYERTYNLAFLHGKVPTFVTEHFGK